MLGTDLSGIGRLFLAARVSGGILDARHFDDFAMNGHMPGIVLRFVAKKSRNVVSLKLRNNQCELYPR